MTTPPPLPPHLTEVEIEEFRKILQEKTGVSFSFEDAAKLSRMLLQALAVIRDVAVQEELKGPHKWSD